MKLNVGELLAEGEYQEAGQGGAQAWHHLVPGQHLVALALLLATDVAPGSQLMGQPSRVWGSWQGWRV